MASISKTYLVPEEIALLENAATNTRDRIFIRVLSHSGCRVSEAIQLTVDDIDLVKGAITIQHLKSRIKASCPLCGARLGKAHVFCPGCGARVEQVVKKAQEYRKVRTLPIDEETLDMLEFFIKKGGPVSKNGKLMLFDFNRHRGWQIMRDCAERAGLGELVNPDTGKTRGVSPHRLRDAFAVNAVKHDDSGDGLRMLQEHLGHQSFDTTARYRKVAGDEHRQWYSKLWKEEEQGG